MNGIKRNMSYRAEHLQVPGCITKSLAIVFHIKNRFISYILLTYHYESLPGASDT